MGVLNGVIVEFGRIDSFIATLGTGSVMYAVTGWITDGGRIVPGPQGLPAAFTGIYDSMFLGLPVPAFYVLALAVALWLVLERLPLGRYMYVIGSNPRAADLVGIPTRRYSSTPSPASGLIVGFAGVLLAAQQQIGNPSVGIDYLLPAFVGALLGSTAIKPGRPNAMGTVVAVAVLAVGLTGIGQLGAEFWAVPLFNGGTLLLAVGLAGYSARRRLRTGLVARTPAGPTDKRAPTARARQGGNGPARSSMTEPNTASTGNAALTAAAVLAAAVVWPAANAATPGTAPATSAERLPHSPRRGPERRQAGASGPTSPGTARPAAPRRYRGKRTIVYVAQTMTNPGVAGAAERRAGSRAGHRLERPGDRRRRHPRRHPGGHERSPCPQALGHRHRRLRSRTRPPQQVAQANAAGIPLIGWHAVAAPGPSRKPEPLHQRHHQSRGRGQDQRELDHRRVQRPRRGRHLHRRLDPLRQEQVRADQEGARHLLGRKLLSYENIPIPDASSRTPRRDLLPASPASGTDGPTPSPSTTCTSPTPPPPSAPPARTAPARPSTSAPATATRPPSSASTSQAVPGRHRARAAVPAGLADHRRVQPRLLRPAAQRIRRPGPHPTAANSRGATVLGPVGLPRGLPEDLGHMTLATCTQGAVERRHGAVTS